MKKTKSRTFSCHTSQHFGKKKGNIIYFKINSVKSKRKKSKNIKQATSVLKKEKKCLLSPNKNNDL